MKFETRELFRKYTDEETFAKIKEYDTLTEMLEACYTEYGERFAITDASGSYTYAQLYEDVACFRLRAPGQGYGCTSGRCKRGCGEGSPHP